MAGGGGAGAGVGRQQLQQGQREGGGLAGSGLGAGHQIASFEHDGNGLGLDGGGDLVALLAHGAQQLGHEAEGFESHGYSWWARPLGALPEWGPVRA